VLAAVASIEDIVPIAPPTPLLITIEEQIERGESADEDEDSDEDGIDTAPKRLNGVPTMGYTTDQMNSLTRIICNEGIYTRGKRRLIAIPWG
jgi:hypothetical protein